METIIGRFDEAIASLMPAHKAAEYRKECADRIKRVDEARNKVRTETALALEQMASALVYPDSARRALEDAEKHLAKALSAACVLDPE